MNRLTQLSSICALAFLLAMPAKAVTVTTISFSTVDFELIALVNLDLFDEEFSFVNNTGETWTDFHFFSFPDDGTFNAELNVPLADVPPGSNPLGETRGTAFYIDSIGGGHDGSAYEGPGSYTVQNAGPTIGSEIDVVGLNILDGGSFTALLDFDVFEANNGLWLLSAIPTTGGIILPPDDNGQIPEPATLALLGLGLAGLGFARKRLR